MDDHRQVQGRGRGRGPGPGQEQLPLFAGVVAADSAPTKRGGSQRTLGNRQSQSRTLVINPHLLAARRIAKRMRRLPDRSDAETRAGLAICAQLKAFLADGSEPH